MGVVIIHNKKSSINMTYFILQKISTVEIYKNNKVTI
jgi:hypothetical protein